MFSYRMNRRKLIWILGIAGLVSLPFLVSNRGVDPTDTAYMLWGYQNAIKSASSAPVNRVLSIWLSMLPLMPMHVGQWLAIRLLGAVVCGGMAIFSALSLSRLFPLKTQLPFLLVAVLIAGQFPTVIGYNTLSYLFFAAEIYLLLSALKNDTTHPLVVCGVLLGTGIFVRLPNLYHFALAAIIIWKSGMCDGQWKKALRQMIFILLPAFIAALVFALLCVLIFGHKQMISEFNRTVFKVFAQPTGEQMTYSLLGTVQNFLSGLINAYKTWMTIIPMVVLAGQALLLLKFHRRMPPTVVWVVNAISVIVVVLLGYAVAQPIIYPYSYPTIYYSALVGGFCILACLIALLVYRKRNPTLSTVAAIALVILFVSPFGTNTLFMAYTNYWHFTLPATAGLVYNLWSDFFKWKSHAANTKYKTPKLITNLLPLALFGVCFAQSMVPAAWHPYFESSYNKLNTPIKGIPILAGMNTTPESARLYETYAQVLEPYADYTLINMGAFAIGPLITGMKPALEHSFPSLQTFSDVVFVERLDLLGDANVLPVISFTDYLHSGHYYDEGDRKTQALLLFIQKHDYRILYSDESLLIYVPPV